MLDKMKQLYQVQKQAREMQKELRETEIEAQGLDGRVSVVINGELKVEKVSIADELLDPAKKKELERGLEDTMREAFTKGQAIAAEKSKEMMKALNIDIPGM